MTGPWPHDPRLPSQQACRQELYSCKGFVLEPTAAEKQESCDGEHEQSSGWRQASHTQASTQKLKKTFFFESTFQKSDFFCMFLVFESTFHMFDFFCMNIVFKSALQTSGFFCTSLVSQPAFGVSLKSYTAFP